MPTFLNLSNKVAVIPKYTGEGHRRRLKDKFLQSGLSGFHDYEIVELLLTLGTPRKDCKQMAKDAIKEFGGLRGVLDASTNDLQRIRGIGPVNTFGIKLFQAISEHYAMEKIQDKVLMSSAQAIAEYLQKSIGHKDKEHFIMLSLDSRYNLIKISNISLGSVDASIVHPREVFKEAIQASATYIVIAHNHPSGDLEPSPEDITLTRRLSDTARIISIELLDHIIVTSTSFLSMRDKGLM